MLPMTGFLSYEGLSWELFLKGELVPSYASLLWKELL
jgi:hypothetical protein